MKIPCFDVSNLMNNPLFQKMSKIVLKTDDCAAPSNYQVFQPYTSPRVDEILWRNSKMCAVAALIVPVTSDETKVSAVDFSFQYEKATPDQSRRKIIPAMGGYNITF